jgi:hypothetical protein
VIAKIFAIISKRKNNPAVSNKKDIAHVSIIQTTREMNSSSSSFASSKVNKTYSKGPAANLVTINEKVNLTKDQQEVLNIICNTYQISISEYMQEALVEAMKFDLEEGNFCDVLLGKIIQEEDDNKKNNSPPPFPTLTNNELDMLRKLHTQIL